MNIALDINNHLIIFLYFNIFVFSFLSFCLFVLLSSKVILGNWRSTPINQS